MYRGGTVGSVPPSHLLGTKYVAFRRQKTDARWRGYGINCPPSVRYIKLTPQNNRAPDLVDKALCIYETTVYVILHFNSHPERRPIYMPAAVRYEIRCAILPCTMLPGGH